MIKKVKNDVPWTYFISDLNCEKIVGTFYKKNYKHQIKKSLELKKLSIQKVINYMLNRKAMVILFNTWINEKDVV